MPEARDGRLRRLWLKLHLWLGIGLGALLVPIGLSGSFLVWHDHFDRLISPRRYAVTSGISGEMLAASALLASATTALGRGFEPIAVRWPEEAGWPATVVARTARGSEAPARPTRMTVYLDPPTGRVLEVVDFRSSLVGVLHRFHENLTIPQWSGRAIVGWAGVAMLIMSLSGIYLWWPRSAGFRRGLRWRRGPTVSSNLHHTIGIWISLPLAAVSATGIYLGFPQQGRALLASVAAMTPQQRGGFNGRLMQQPILDVDRAVAAAQGALVDMLPRAVFMPTQQSQAWRVQLRDRSGETVTVMVEDKSGTATRVAPLQGDRIALWIRRIHEGSHLGRFWQIAVFLCGLVPLVFAVTGFLIWRRSVRMRRLGGRVVPQLGAAE